MKIICWAIGKTAFPYIREGMEIYEKRIKKYIPFEFGILPDIKNSKNLNFESLKEKEATLVLNRLKADDFLVILDERGKVLSSPEFADMIERHLYLTHKRIVFLIGGAYGFSDKIYSRANSRLSLSKMTFSHQMIRLFFMEQLYRSFTIMRGEPYHNE